MSHLSLSSSPRPPSEKSGFAGPMENSGWLDLPTAAKRKGCVEGNLRRYCLEKYLGMGLARQVAKANGRKAWQVHISADPAFAPVKFPESIGTDLRQFPEAERKRALFRRSILDRWEKAIAGGLAMKFTRNQCTEQFLQCLDAEGVKITRATLYNWEKSWRTGGLAALTDGRAQQAKPLASDPFLEEVARIYLSKRQPKLTVCYEIACLKAVEQKWEVRSIHACRRHVERLDKGLVLKLRYGEEAFTNEAEPFIQRDYSTLESNELWNSDHHRFDVIVKLGETKNVATGEVKCQYDRPWLTAFQDARSRKIVAFRVYAHDPNSDVVLSVFREAVLDHGVPRTLLIDNGKDFDCRALTGFTKKQRWALRRKIHVELDSSVASGLFPALGIKLIHATPYHGQSKPIERWFGFVETRTVTWNTYCGKDAQSKPEDLEQQLERGEAPTLEEFTAWFSEWVRHFNAGHSHSGDAMEGKTPDQVFNENLGTKITAPRELIDELCLKTEGPVQVHQNGVTYKGLAYGQYELKLQQRLKKKVMLKIDPRDLSTLRVYDTDGRFICLATSNDRVPANADIQTLREANAQKGRDRKLRFQYIQRRPRMADDTPQRLLESMAKKTQAAQEQTTPPAPGSILPVRHAIEGELPAVQRAIEQHTKKAVGAESLPSRFIYGAASVEQDEDSPSPRASLSQLMSSRLKLAQEGSSQEDD